MNILIVCNGERPAQALFDEALRWSDLLIGADGGGNTARLLGTLPDVVIGDLDSFKEKEKESIEIIHKPSQYANDLEKALELADAKEAQNVRILGATGLRLDHTLKNLSVLKQYHQRFSQIVFEDNYGCTLLLPRQYRKEIPAGTTISLFPLSGKVTGITTNGLEYPLSNDKLENGVADGTSNTVVSSPISVTYSSGDLLLFIAK